MDEQKIRAALAEAGTILGVKLGLKAGIFIRVEVDGETYTISWPMPDPRDPANALAIEKFGMPFEKVRVAFEELEHDVDAI